MSKELEKVTRVEVIDENGRSYVNWNVLNNVEVQLQDDGRTMKIFITRNKDKIFPDGKTMDKRKCT